MLILVTDLYEGGDPESMLRRAASLIRSGVRLIVLLALSDDGAPAYDHTHAAALAALGAPVFACTPDQFPEMLAAALEGRDVGAWASSRTFRWHEHAHVTNGDSVVHAGRAGDRRRSAGRSARPRELHHRPLDSAACTSPRTPRGAGTRRGGHHCHDPPLPEAIRRLAC